MLTLAQQRTYDFIKRFMVENDHAPTTAEIARGTGIKSRGVVHRYLKALAKAKLIKLIAGRHRNIELLDKIIGSRHLPLIGEIAAGKPIEAITDNKVVDLTAVFLGPNRYALRVKGNSMMDEGIFDGDIVIIEKTSIARNGQVVVALVNQQEATLKKIFHAEDGKIKLMPANKDFKSITYPKEQIEVQGIYIGLLRLK